MSPRSSQRVDRRRRVLTDDSRNDAPLTRPRIFRGDDEGPLSRYDEAALQAINAPIARYIPFRPFSLVVWFLVGLVPILGLMLLDQRRFQIANWLGPDALRVFDLTAAGSLARWCASFTFAAAALVILGIYSVRRHRRDDYRARFAMWQWVLGVVALACVDSAVGLHGMFEAGCERLFGAPSWNDGSAWWVGVWGTVLLATTIRLALEMSASRRSIGWMVGAAACYLWCGLVQTHPSGFLEHNWAQSSQAPLLLLGHHFMLFALVTYARDVVREAMGIVETVTESETPQAQPKTSKPAASATTQTTKTKAPKTAPQLRAVSAETPSPTQQPAAKTRAAKKTTAPSKAAAKPTNAQPPVIKMTVDHDTEEPEDMSKLSRAERRRLRKEQRRKKAA